MVWFHTFWVQTDVTFFAFDIDNISTHLSQPHDSRNHVLYVHAIQRCWEIVLVGFCHTFPGFQAQVREKTLTMEYYSHESCQIISKHSLQLHLLSKRKKATTTFWNGFAHDNLTWTGHINHQLPYFHYTPWKDLALARLHAFSQLSTSTLLTKLDLATNSWWQRWQLVVSLGNKQIVSIRCVIKCFPGFLLKCSLFL